MRIREELRRPLEDQFGAITDEVGGYHKGGCGWRPDGSPCGECSSMSCGACDMYLGGVDL